MNPYRYNGKEFSEATGLYAYGARYYDPAIGRFTGVDPIADEFAWVSVYNYAENEPVASIDLWGLQRVRVHFQVLNRQQLGGGVQGRLLAFFSPRHAYLEVQTQNENTLLELGGPRDGSSTGTPYRQPFNSDEQRNGQFEHNVIRPDGFPEGGGDYTFENKILDVYEVLTADLPDYHGLGPNSNGFINSVVLLAGGEADLIYEQGTLPGAEELTPYFEAYFNARPGELSDFKERISGTISSLTAQGEALRNSTSYNKGDLNKALELKRRVEFFQVVQEQINNL